MSVGRPQWEMWSGKGEFMNSEKFLITQSWKNPWEPEGRAQKYGQDRGEL